jgi:hypothetical protein
MDAPLTEATGWHPALPTPAHPIEAWLDLMDVVEALCPTWPAVAPTRDGDYRL